VRSAGREDAFVAGDESGALAARMEDDGALQDAERLVAAMEVERSHLATANRRLDLREPHGTLGREDRCARGAHGRSLAPGPTARKAADRRSEVR
jgi:hypothetical protein